MRKDIKSLFQRLGLKDRESQIYLACLQSGDGLFVHEIVKQTRVARNSVYLILARLLRRGFVTKIKIGRRLRYKAEAPRSLLFQQRKLVEDFEQAEPMLTKLGKPAKEMEVLSFEGIEGLRRVHDDILMQTRYAEGDRKHILGFSSGADTIKLYPNIQKTYIDRRVKNGSWFKAIAPQNAQPVREWSNDPTALRSVKYLPDSYFQFRMEIQIYADSIMLYSTAPPFGGVVIRNARIARFYARTFQSGLDISAVLKFR